MQGQHEALKDVNRIQLAVYYAIGKYLSKNTRKMAKCNELPARYYYIHRTAKEHLSVDALEKIIKQQAFENQNKVPNNFSKTISNSSMARKAVMMFKDSYAFIPIRLIPHMVRSVGLEPTIQLEQHP